MSTAHRTSTSRRASSRSATTAGATTCRSRSCPGSMYHLSKVHDSHNIHFACRVWGLRATDLQSGRRVRDPAGGDRPGRPAAHAVRLRRRVRDRAQPVLPPGGDRPSVDGLRSGGQTRGYLNIEDTLRCVELAVHAPRRRRASTASSTSSPSSSRCWQLAELVQKAGAEVGMDVTVDPIDNPRVEARAALLQRRAHQAARPRAASRTCWTRR